MRRALLILLAVALALVTGATWAAGVVDVKPGVSNPHGDPTACNACHAPGASPTEPGPALPIVATCRGCHPTADMHPVGMAPHNVKVPDSYPLEDGKVTCATCHAEPAHGGDAAKLSAPWHRGGPYTQVTRFCYSCHESSAYTRASPHHPDKPRDPNDPTCAACHTGTPSEGASFADAHLRAGEDVCTGTCHKTSPHAGISEHMGKEVDADRAATLPASVVLLDGRVACYSCHDVHDSAAETPEKGRRELVGSLHGLAMDGDWKDLAGADLSWPGNTDPAHPPMLALPINDGSLCRACHGDGP